MYVQGNSDKSDMFCYLSAYHIAYLCGLCLHTLFFFFLPVYSVYMHTFIVNFFMEMGTFLSVRGDVCRRWIEQD